MKQAIIILVLLMAGRALADDCRAWRPVGDGYLSGLARDSVANNGTSARLYCKYSATIPSHAILTFDGERQAGGITDSLPDNAVIDICSLQVVTAGGLGAATGDVKGYILFKPHREDSACWNYWSKPGYDDWTTHGCGSGDDGGSFNYNDGTGADRTATEEFTITVDDATNGVFYGVIDASWMQALYDGDVPELSVLLVAQAPSTKLESMRPLLIVWFHIASDAEILFGLPQRNQQGELK